MFKLKTKTKQLGLMNLVSLLSCGWASVTWSMASWGKLMGFKVEKPHREGILCPERLIICWEWEKQIQGKTHISFTWCFEDTDNNLHSPGKHKLYDSWRALKWIRGWKEHKVTCTLATLRVLFIKSPSIFFLVFLSLRKKLHWIPKYVMLKVYQNLYCHLIFCVFGLPTSPNNLNPYSGFSVIYFFHLPGPAVGPESDVKWNDTVQVQL